MTVDKTNECAICGRQNDSRVDMLSHLKHTHSLEVRETRTRKHERLYQNTRRRIERSNAANNRHRLILNRLNTTCHTRRASSTRSRERKLFTLDSHGCDLDRTAANMELVRNLICDERLDALILKEQPAEDTHA